MDGSNLGLLKIRFHYILAHRTQLKTLVETYDWPGLANKRRNTCVNNISISISQQETFRGPNNSVTTTLGMRVRFMKVMNSTFECIFLKFIIHECLVCNSNQ